ncbi:glycosyltransferase [Candidatus Woesearchaeota archaeon]|nr:glycosyltransferase [Candidatus Woesearchaeota archaeon]
MENQSIILYMSTFPPRECGIATFTKDLTDAVDNKFFPTVRSRILALNRNGVNIYNYPRKVMFQLTDNDLDGYINTAKQINKTKTIKLVNIQHEFGIFGGAYGEYLLAFLEILEKPAIVTFHSVLPNPEEKLKKVVRSIADRVESIVVMTSTGIKILREDYGIINTKIHLIPHGVHVVNYEEQKKEKTRLGLKDKIILCSFGMISSGKGYEYVIESLPEVVKKFPNLIYLIVGETHPVVRKHEGENYRNLLENKIKELGLEKHVKFYNKYLELREIISFIKASDIYISSSLTPEQITSGTLVYAMSCGRPVVSTPFLHAKDIVADDKGRLVEFKNPESYSKAILELLSDEMKRREMEKNAYAYTRHMTWPNVALSYGNIFKEYLGLPEIYVKRIPEINTTHLNRLTDDFGIIQFANYATPDIESGYTLDDNARALFVCGKYYNKFGEYKQLKLIKTYLDYIKYVQAKDGKLYNYVDKHKRVNFKEFSEDAHGRAVYALGFTTALKAVPPDIKEQAKQILLKGLSPIDNFLNARSIAFSLVGLHYYNKNNNSAENISKIKKLADYLVSLYEASYDKEWKWFEEKLTYSNSRLPEAMFYAYLSTKDKKYLDVAKASLDFLISKTFHNNIFVPIGHRGWYVKGGEKSYYDQQPVDTGCMVQTLILAHKTTGEKKYIRHASNAFHWFLGRNYLKQMIYDDKTGGCFDGLGEKTVNLNRGAESTLAYLTARLCLLSI